MEAPAHDVAAGAARPPGETDLGRVLTVPNGLSLLRLALLAGFAVLVLDAHQRVAAAALLALAGITDFLDGYVARRFNQVTTLGKVLDPTIDRLLLITAAAVIVADGAVPVFVTVIVLVREAAVAVMSVLLAAMGARRIDVLFIGKAGTFGLMVCFPLLLVGHGPGPWAHAVRIAAEIGLVPAIALSLAAAVAYVPAARRALAEGRAERKAANLPDRGAAAPRT